MNLNLDSSVLFYLKLDSIVLFNINFDKKKCFHSSIWAKLRNKIQIWDSGRLVPGAGACACVAWIIQAGWAVLLCLLALVAVGILLGLLMTIGYGLVVM